MKIAWQNLGKRTYHTMDTVPKTVETEEYHEHIPGKRGDISDFSNNPNTLKLDSYILPPILDEIPTPILEDHAFGIVTYLPSPMKEFRCKMDGELIRPRDQGGG